MTRLADGRLPVLCSVGLPDTNKWPGTVRHSYCSVLSMFFVRYSPRGHVPRMRVKLGENQV